MLGWVRLVYIILRLGYVSRAYQKKTVNKYINKWQGSDKRTKQTLVIWLRNYGRGNNSKREWRINKTHNRRETTTKEGTKNKTDRLEKGLKGYRRAKQQQKGVDASRWGLTTTRGPVEEDALAGGHAKLEEFVWVLHGVLHQLLRTPHKAMVSKIIIMTMIHNNNNNDDDT